LKYKQNIKQTYLSCIFIIQSIISSSLSLIDWKPKFQKKKIQKMKWFNNFQSNF